MCPLSDRASFASIIVSREACSGFLFVVKYSTTSTMESVRFRSFDASSCSKAYIENYLLLMPLHLVWPAHYSTPAELGSGSRRQMICRSPARCTSCWGGSFSSPSGRGWRGRVQSSHPTKRQKTSQSASAWGAPAEAFPSSLTARVLDSNSPLQSTTCCSTYPCGQYYASLWART